MAEPVRHRQTKGAATDMFGLQPPRHISTLPTPATRPFALQTGSICQILSTRTRSVDQHRGAARVVDRPEQPGGTQVTASPAGDRENAVATIDRPVPRKNTVISAGRPTR